MLYDEVYVSSSNEDLQVFEAVARHPVLSKCIRRLVYDGSEFLLKISKTEYFLGVYSQIATYEYPLRIEEGYTPLNISDPEITRFLGEVAERPRKFFDVQSQS